MRALYLWLYGYVSALWLMLGIAVKHRMPWVWHLAKANWQRFKQVLRGR